MNNKKVGLLIIIIGAIIGFIIYSFNRAMNNIVTDACSHGSGCPMWHTISFQTNISLVIMAAVILVGVYFLFFTKSSNKAITQKEFPAKNLDTEEKKIVEIIQKDQGSIFQSRLVEKSGFNKVKITRILDKLEGKGIIERKRRGMTNVVILK